MNKRQAVGPVDAANLKAARLAGLMQPFLACEVQIQQLGLGFRV